MKIELHNQENKDNKRWLLVLNSVEGDTRHRDFRYFTYKYQMLWQKFVITIFWGGFDPENLFVQTYDMQNLKKWKTGELTKELIKSGYFEEMKRNLQSRKIRF